MNDGQTELDAGRGTRQRWIKISVVNTFGAPPKYFGFNFLADGQSPSFSSVTWKASGTKYKAGVVVCILSATCSTTTLISDVKEW